MKPWLHLFWLVPLVAFGATRAWQGLGKPTCADFLKNAGIQHEALKFKSCEPAFEAQIPVLRARYEIPGEHAAAIETQLERRYGMAPLKFVCCIWEPTGGRSGQWVERGYDMDVGMGSEETVYNTRAEWPKIKTFFVTVNLLLEEP